ncbi:MAG: AAA family ATPase [Syntrophaceae bacterium]|nr:AAA family ATPase [Syntrophaceae bacterium]
MKIRKLILTNFRPFLGQQEIEFSCSKSKNVTVVHAENGLGKTTLLNALLWGLYGKDGLTEDVESPDRIVNETVEAQSEDPNETYAEVLIFFEHEDIEYTLRRRLTLAQQRVDASKTELRLESKQFGQTKAEKDAQSKLNTILPKGISPYLFFNGERIDNLGRTKSREDIKEAIHQMLGLSLMQRTIADLESQNVAGRFRQELRKNADEAMQKLLDMQEKAEKKRKTATEMIKNSNREIAALKRKIEKIDAKLKANEEVQKLQSEREERQKSVEKQNMAIQEAGKDLKLLISNEACMLFTADLFEEGNKVTSRLRSEGRIPARILKDFIQDLIKAEKCICKRPIKKETPEYMAVLEQLEAATDPSFNEAVSALDNALGAIDGKAEEARDRIKEAYRRYEELQEEYWRNENRIKEISQKIGEKDDEEIQHLESDRESNRLKIEEHNSNIGRAHQQIEDATKELQDLNHRIEQCKQKADKADLARRRLATAENIAEILRNMLEAETQDLRKVLNEEIRENFAKIIFKDYWADITPDFDLKILKRVEGQVIEVAKSTGENQITSFAFIGSLVALARRRDELPSILKGVQGGEYPIVMDSPFGTLGEGYRASVSRMLPQLAPQVLVFVSPTQWKDSVEENLMPQAGKRYLLQYQGKNPPKDLAKEVEFNGNAYEQIVDSETEKTQIVEVK